MPPTEAAGAVPFDESHDGLRCYTQASHRNRIPHSQRFCRHQASTLSDLMMVKANKQAGKSGLEAKKRNEMQGDAKSPTDITEQV